MATAEQIKKIIQSHYQNDNVRFNSMVMQLAAHEANQGHTSLARELKLLVDNSKSDSKKLVPFRSNLGDLIIREDSQDRMSNLVLENQVRDRIEKILVEYKHREKLKKHSMMNRRKILLAGPPGTGKTLTASVLAGELGLPFCTIMMDKMVTKYMGETSAKLRQIFDTISENVGVYLFDEFDAIGSERGMENDVGEMRRVLNSFLQLIEQDNSEGLIIAATNNLKILDQALFRRFDDIIHYDLPQDKEIIRLIRNRLGSFANNNLDITSIVKMCDNLSHSEITRACDDSVKESILSDRLVVNERDLEKAILHRVAVYTREN